MRKPSIARIQYNSANFAYHICEPPWTPDYQVSYCISFFTGPRGSHSERSNWWGPKIDPKNLDGGFGLIKIPADPTGQATARGIYRKLEGSKERLIQLSGNTASKYQDDVR